MPFAHQALRSGPTLSLPGIFQCIHPGWEICAGLSFQSFQEQYLLLRLCDAVPEGWRSKDRHIPSRQPRSCSSYPLLSVPFSVFHVTIRPHMPQLESASGFFPLYGIRQIIVIIWTSRYHFDPRPPRTTNTVLIRIFTSIPRFQFFMYFISSFTTSSKSVISLLPLTCHMPVSPGFTASLAR